MTSPLFLTGATGFLGHSVLPRLAASQNRNQRIVCLIRGNPPSSAPPGVEYVRGDLLDAPAYTTALEGCGAVLHMAAATGKLPPAEYYRVNRDGTAALLQAARKAGVSRFIYVSTVAVKFQDQSRYYYAQSKQEAEAAVMRSELRWTVVRPAIILGKNAPVLEGMSRLAGLPIVPVFGDGRAQVQPVFVDDLADCLAAMLEDSAAPENIVEIGGPEALSVEDLLLRIRRAQGKGTAPVMHLPVRPLAASLGAVEPFLRPLLPFTAGQLASFTNAGTTAAHPWLAPRQARMKTVDEMLSLSVAHGQRPA